MQASAIDEADLVRRAMALRKQRRIGVLWADSGRFWISESELDPWGSRVRISLARLLDMVVAAEAPLKKPAASETAIARSREGVA